MRLTLDATYALDPHPTGVARYSARLIDSLATLPLAALDLEITLAARPRRFAALRRTYPTPRFRRVLLQEPLNVLLSRRTDIFHGLNQRLPAYRFRRQVTTIHDVFALSSNSYSSPDFRAKFGAVIQDAVKRSDALIAVSAYTKDELCRITGCDPARVTVVHHGIEPAASASSLRREIAAVRAIERLPASVTLKVAGGVGYGADETLNYVRRAGLGERVHFLGHCDEAALDRLYAGATALIFPSLEEGFGFPVLEAMARGVPVIASNTSSIPEISGDAALLFHPLDHESMAAACLRLLDDAHLAQDLVGKGRAQAAHFNWERAARETFAVYLTV
jgi:glycosyltransferase involved in cell wall biosynthesis